jgi:hypothetical protein
VAWWRSSTLFAGPAMSHLRVTRGFAAKLRRMREANRSLRKHRANFNFAAERFHVFAQRAQVPIRAAFQLRHGRLRLVELLGKLGLRHFHFGAQITDLDLSQSQAR